MKFIGSNMHQSQPNLVNSNRSEASEMQIARISTLLGLEHNNLYTDCSFQRIFCPRVFKRIVKMLQFRAYGSEQGLGLAIKHLSHLKLFILRIKLAW